uniref:UDP-D-xylose:beta-D-glucoside alpha-1,3-D-xylosyltransferase n=1 Tax=Plectus sambesii TaxID=2011161 RepID=A0A914UXM1_9BILA
DIQFPEGTDGLWRALFKPCACQRLFIPDLLTDVDALIYVDTDVIFLTPPEKLWQHFSLFNKSHIAALAPETEDAQTNWYVRFARHPFYRPLGVNSGVMLMNLTRMRQFKWGSFLWPLYQKYRYNITWGDQDIINIIFSMNPKRLYVYGCEWNFRPDHCMYTSTCKAAENGGAMVLHGSRGYFHKEDKQPAFLTAYQTLRSFPLSSSSVCLKFLPTLDRKLSLLPPTSNCAKVHEIFLHSLRSYCER